MAPIAGRLLRRAAAVITVSQYSAGRISETFEVPHERIHVVPNGVDHERFRPGTADERSSARARFSDGRPYVLFAGGRTPRKNLPRLLEAVADARRTANVDLVLAGPAGTADATGRSAAHPWIHRVGHIADELVPLLMQGAECLAFPSLEEGFGLPVLEAMACGTPVVTSKASSLPEVAGGHAALVDPMDVASIAAGLELVVTEPPAARAARIAAALEHARGYTWERAAALTLDVYRETAT